MSQWRESPCPLAADLQPNPGLEAGKTQTVRVLRGLLLVSQGHKALSGGDTGALWPRPGGRLSIQPPLLQDPIVRPGCTSFFFSPKLFCKRGLIYCTFFVAGRLRVAVQAVLSWSHSSKVLLTQTHTCCTPALPCAGLEQPLGSFSPLPLQVPGIHPPDPAAGRVTF